MGQTEGGRLYEMDEANYDFIWGIGVIDLIIDYIRFMSDNKSHNLIIALSVMYYHSIAILKKAYFLAEKNIIRDDELITEIKKVVHSYAECINMQIKYMLTKKNVVELENKSLSIIYEARDTEKIVLERMHDFICVGKVDTVHTGFCLSDKR